jgi:uncharacterized protein (DUF1800 family)
MTEREKSAHLLRRFGLGAGHAEVARYPESSKAVLEALLKDDKIDDGFSISPWRFIAQKDGKLETGSYQVGPWWALRMVMTRAPLVEKLTLFWHDHFALDGDKVGEGPTMMAYLDNLRTKGRGKFRDLLKATMSQGAMLMFLDGHTSHKIHPNENLARETFELFTMGVGSGYTETDIKELARALTGWSMHYMGSYLDEPYDRTKKRADEARMALSNFCWVPNLHDDGVKTILGKSGRFTADEALDIICQHPATATYICTKLWSFFAYPNPDAKVVAKLTAAWKKTDGDIRSVLRAIAEQPEFWSDKCVGTMPKSPADWVVGLIRSIDRYPALVTEQGKPLRDIDPIPQSVRDAANGAYYLMAQQGLQLLYPPNVAGWNWAEGWIGADTSIKRIRTCDAIFWGGGEARPWSVEAAAKIKASFKPADSGALVDAFAALLDARLTPGERTALVGVCDKRGGLAALEKKDQAANLFAGMARVLFAIPDFQLC